MLEQNYTNAEDKGRFGFSESGKFRAPYKSETALIVIFTLIFIFGSLGGLAGGAIFLNTMMASSPEGTEPLLYAMTGAVIFLLSIAVSFLIFKLGISYTKRGFDCTFSATEELFTANIGGDLHTIKYSDVTAVKFTPRSIFGKIHGYDVDIFFGNRVEQYAVTFEGQYQSEKTTPFYIIKERMQIIEDRRSDEEVKLSEIKNKANRALSKEDIEKARAKKKTTEERVEALFAKSSEMSEVAPKKPSGKTATVLTADNLDAAENARIAESERQKQLTELEKINRERAINEREIIAQGTFLIGRTGVPVAVCQILATAATLVAIAYILSIIPIIYMVPFTYALVELAIYAVIYILLMTVLIDIIRGGNEYKYTANQREFSFSRKKGKGAVAHFFYKDILSVDYCPHKFLWFDNGYYVTLETKSGFFTYKYVFPRFRHPIAEKNLPFEVIREQIAEKPKLPEQQSVRLGLSKKKTALMLILAAACAFTFALPAIIRFLTYYIVVMYALAIFGIFLCIRQILKGDVYRYRSDNQEFVIRRADGAGKTTRIKFTEAQKIVYKRGLFGAAVLIKTSEKTLKFRYVYPKPFQMKLLCETPFAVFEKNGGRNER